MSYLGENINTEDFSDINDIKITELNFSNPATASYIIDRKSATFHSTGGNIYSTTSGGTLIRFNIDSPTDWLDPSSVRVQFDIRNTAVYAAGTNNEQLFLTGGPHSFFKRLRVLSRGIVLHDITEYNRVHEMFSYFKAQNVKTNELSESIYAFDHFGSEFQTDVIDGVTTGNISSGIRPGETMTVMFKPFCGILNQEKYLPLKYCPLVLELEIVTNASDPVVSDGSKNYTGAAAYTAALTSQSWQLEQFKVRCDLLKLDNTLQNEFDNQLLGSSSNRLSIRISNYMSQTFPVNGSNDLSFNMTRALSNLNRVFVSFIKAGGVDRFYSKEYNTFYSTLYANNILTHTSPGTFTATTISDLVNALFKKAIYSKSLDPVYNTQLQIGGKLFPEYPIQSSQESFYLLKKSINDDKIFNKHIHAVDIKAKSYLSDKFIVVFDTCKVNSGTAAYAGIDVRNGSNINLRFKFPPTLDNALLPTYCHTVLESEATFRVMGTFVYLDE